MAKLEITEPASSSSSTGKPFKIAVVVVILGVVLFIVGLVLIVIGVSKGECETRASKASQNDTAFCQFSEEATRAGFGKFLEKLKKTYYELHPFNVHYDPDIVQATDQKGATERVKTEFVAYDTTPSVIKTRTDTAWKLLDELNGLNIDTEKLKPRERKALFQARHYLKQVFGQPYDVNFYTGDWMTGPDLFCYRQICYMGYSISRAMKYFQPHNMKDVELIEVKLKTYKVAIKRYIDNMKMGVIRGMVRDDMSCIAGINTLKVQYRNISRFNETGKKIFFQ